MNRLEWRASEGESPVTAVGEPTSKFGLGKPGLNMGGPSSKAKYYLMTDSEPVRRLNDEKHRDERGERDLKPCAYKRWESFGMTACFLHNEPASWSIRRA